jgi:hypothetical protein
MKALNLTSEQYQTFIKSLETSVYYHWDQMEKSWDMMNPEEDRQDHLNELNEAMALLQIHAPEKAAVLNKDVIEYLHSTI